MESPATVTADGAGAPVVPPVRLSVPALTAKAPLKESVAPLRVSVPTPFLTRERLFSLVPAPPMLPAKVVLATWLTVSTEAVAPPPTIAFAATPVSDATVWLLAPPTLSPSCSAALAERVRSPELRRLLAPPLRMTRPEPWRVVAPR